MEKCLHVSKIRPAWDHSILNPEKWMCYICRTTESVWACLSCSNVACGRFNEKHALKHFQESKHPISIEVNNKYVYCYVCDDYVMNDNAAGDIKLLRSALSAIATQKFTDIESRGRRLLRSYSHTGVVQRDTAAETDKLATADWHLRQRRLARVFGAWRTYIQQKKSTQQTRTGTSAVSPSASLASTLPKKRTIKPGITGLRNLGNTCYMNSVLQILSHIEPVRDFFLKMNYGFDTSPNGSPHVKVAPAPQETRRRSPRAAARLFQRQTTIECWQHLMGDEGVPCKRPMKGGLNGGSSQPSPAKPHLATDLTKMAVDEPSENISLCGELHGLLRVLWSGKWAQVSPHVFLRAVWQAIPQFKGYGQHDAQEFLCELLDKIQRELDFSRATPSATQLRSIGSQPVVHPSSSSQLLNDLFQGQLVSRVTCEGCGNVSETFEPYMDLSLEFPKRYQITTLNARVAEDNCHITEMLAKFTEEETLEGRIYACEKCNAGRRKSASPVYTEARKQLLINKLPPVLRLHLKRFRWSGRMHREKISTHVAPDDLLDLTPFCSPSAGPSCQYRLTGVIIHHGRGFGSGHYTAYTWNTEAGSWVNCNDSRMILSNLEDVLTAQAYILVYRAAAPRQPSDDVDITPTLKAETSADTVSYSLRSDNTLPLSEDQTCDLSPSSSLASSASSTLYSLSTEKFPSVSPRASPVFNLPYDESDVCPPLLKCEASSTQKADGTGLSTDDSLDSISSGEDSFHAVDGEISFNLRNTYSAEDRRSSLRSQTTKRSFSRSFSNDELDLSSSGIKRSRQMSFGTAAFYGTPSRSQETKSSYDSLTTPTKHRRKTRRSEPVRLDSKQVARLEQILEKDRKVSLTESGKHLKRRKSTFW